MGKFILLDARIEVDGVVLSNHANSVEVEDSSEEQDVTGFGSANRETMLGLGDGTFTVTFFQDFASGKVDSTLAPLKGENDPFTVNVRGTTAAISAQNPEYTMGAVLPSYRPLSGGVGEPSTIEASFRNATQSGIVRKTA